jgi:hypothetical protein
VRHGASVGFEEKMMTPRPAPIANHASGRMGIVAKEDRLMKVSVKGSQDFGWGLTQSYLAKATKLSGKKADYHGAIDLWLKRHSSRTAFCFVQFGE